MFQFWSEPTINMSIIYTIPSGLRRMNYALKEYDPFHTPYREFKLLKGSRARLKPEILSNHHLGKLLLTLDPSWLPRIGSHSLSVTWHLGNDTKIQQDYLFETKANSQQDDNINYVLNFHPHYYSQLPIGSVREIRMILARPISLNERLADGRQARTGTGSYYMLTNMAISFPNERGVWHFRIQFNQRQHCKWKGNRDSNTFTGDQPLHYTRHLHNQ